MFNYAIKGRGGFTLAAPPLCSRGVKFNSQGPRRFFKFTYFFHFRHRDAMQCSSVALEYSFGWKILMHCVVTYFSQSVQGADSEISIFSHTHTHTQTEGEIPEEAKLIHWQSSLDWTALSSAGRCGRLNRLTLVKSQRSNRVSSYIPP